MRKRTTQLSVSLAVLAFSSMASSVFSGEPLRDSFTVIITTHLDMIARSNESYFLDRPIYRRSNNGIAGDGDAVDHNSTRSNRGGIAGDGGAVDHNSTRSNRGGIAGDGDAVDHNSTRSNRGGIAGDGGGATEQIGGVGSDYQGACGGEGSGAHGDITGAIRVTQHHDWIVQQINDGGEHVVNILTSKIPNGTGQQINDGGEVEGDDQRVLSPGSDPILRKRPGRVNGDQYQTNTTHINNYGTISMASKVESDSKDWIGIVDDQAVGSNKDQYEGSRAGAKPNGTVILSDRVHYGDGDAVDHNSSRSNHGIVGGGEQHKIYDYSQCTWNGIAGDGGGATEQIGSVGSFYQDARGSEGSGGHGDLYGASRVDLDEGSRAGADDLNAMDVLGRRWRGDANRDGVVTGTDLIVVQQNFGLSVALDGLLGGDANNDGQVTGMDLIEVQQTFGQVEDWGDDVVNILTTKIPNGTGQQINDSTDAAVVAAVPEPATIALMSAGLLFMRKTRRTR